MKVSWASFLKNPIKNRMEYSWRRQNFRQFLRYTRFSMNRFYNNQGYEYEIFHNSHEHPAFHPKISTLSWKMIFKYWISFSVATPEILASQMYVCVFVPKRS